MVSQIHGSVPVFSTEPAATTSVPATGDNIFEQLLQKAAAENRQNPDARTGGILSANRGKAILTEVLGNQPTTVNPGPAAPVSPAADGAAAETPFVPSFQTDVQVTNSFTGQVTELNPMYFATSQTAQFIADKFGTGQVREQASYGSGPYYSTASQYYIETPNGQWLNAGLLAWNYQRMPEAQWPGLADQQIRANIAQAGGSVG
jgi:hypothetical protein